MTDAPGEHPLPHADLADRSPRLFNLEPSQPLSRIHNRTDGPIFFGRTGSNRFDAPDASFGVLYAGSDEHCAFIETFGQLTGTRVVTRRALRQRHLSYLNVKKPIRLIDLAISGGLARLGADNRLLSGSHAIARQWAAALRSHPVKADGLLYPARHDPARTACALFERPATDFQVNDAGSLLDRSNARLLAKILDTYQFGLID